MTEDAVQPAADPLSRESLQRAGFRASEVQQQGFLARVVARQLARMELPTRPELLHGAAAGLSFLGAIALWSRGAGEVATAGVVSGAWHFAFGFARARARKKRAAREGPDDPAACYRDDDGVLRLRLEEGERVLLERDADGEVRKGLRYFGGAANAFWGMLLSGLPPAVFAPLGGVLATILTSLGVFVGTLLFGRGVAAVVANKPVERVVLTDRRVAVLADDGVAQSILLEHLRVRPLVVGRDDGTATLAIESRSLPASRPLPAHAIFGVYALADDEARAIAAQLMEARRARL